jgi:hypothetical protein
MVSENKLYFPKSLLLQFLEANTGNPVRNIAVTLTLYAREKNDYHLGPSLSGIDGEVVITANWVKEAIQHASNTSLMDYATPMDHCFPQVSVKVMSADEIAKAGSAMKLYGIENGSPDIAHTLLELENAINETYEPIETKITLDNPSGVSRSIQIKLRKIGA